MAFADRSVSQRFVSGQRLAAATEPRFMRLTGVFNVRGGVYTSVVAEHRATGWTPAPAVSLPGTSAV